jgi:hypothetical protein
MPVQKRGKIWEGIIPKSFLVPLLAGFLLLTAAIITSGFSSRQDIRSSAAYPLVCGSQPNQLCVLSLSDCSVRGGMITTDVCPTNALCCSTGHTPTPTPAYHWFGNTQTNLSCSEWCRRKGYPGCSEISIDGSITNKNKYWGKNGSLPTNNNCELKSGSCNTVMALVGKCNYRTSTGGGSRVVDSTNCYCYK